MLFSIRDNCLNIWFELMLLLIGQEIIADNSDALTVLVPHVRVLVDVRVDTQHVKVSVDCQNVVALKKVEA